jgi:hypothetical protein
VSALDVMSVKELDKRGLKGDPVWELETADDDARLAVRSGGFDLKIEGGRKLPTLRRDLCDRWRVAVGFASGMIA